MDVACTQKPERAATWSQPLVPSSLSRPPPRPESQPLVPTEFPEPNSTASRVSALGSDHVPLNQTPPRPESMVVETYPERAISVAQLLVAGVGLAVLVILVMQDGRAGVVPPPPEPDQPLPARAQPLGGGARLKSRNRSTRRAPPGVLDAAPPGVLGAAPAACHTPRNPRAGC